MSCPGERGDRPVNESAPLQFLYSNTKQTKKTSLITLPPLPPISFPPQFCFSYYSVLFYLIINQKFLFPILCSFLFSLVFIASSFFKSKCFPFSLIHVKFSLALIFACLFCVGSVFILHSPFMSLMPQSHLTSKQRKGKLFFTVLGIACLRR